MELKPHTIAVLCNYELLPERVGGMDYFFWGFQKKCQENDIEIDWFFPNTGSHGQYPEFTIYPSQNKSIEACFLAFCKNNQPKYSHIITHFLELCTPFYYKIKKISQATIITVDHNPRPIHGYPFKKRIQKKVKGMLFGRYIDLFVGVSHYSVNEILKDFGGFLKPRTKTIYNGVMIGSIRQRTHRNSIKPSFIVTSHLRESKGIQDLVDAVALLPDAIKNDLKIDLYGNGPYKNELMKKIGQNQLQKNFHFFGSKANLNEVYCRYDYLLQPTHMECFSLSILESLAANVAVITTRVGGNEEAIQNGVNGFLFKAKDIHQLKTILQDLFLGKQFIERHTRKSVAERFTLEKMIENHYNLL